MSSEQLVLTLPVRPALGREDFFEAPSNALALRQIDAWEDWAGDKLVLIGPKASGKSHLIAVWAEAADATVLTLKALDKRPKGHVAVEDADLAAGDSALEEALFHLHNHVMANGKALLLTARDVPAHWGIALPDLASRFAAADIARLGPPDDALLSAVLVKLFTDRQLNVPASVIPYLIARIDRSFAEAERVVARLDEASMRERKAISVRFAGQVLEAKGN